MAVLHLPPRVASGCGGGSGDAAQADGGNPPPIIPRLPITVSNSRVDYYLLYRYSFCPKMPVPIAKGVIVLTALLVTAGIALYESPQVRRFFEQNRQKVLEALYPDSYPQQPAEQIKTGERSGRRQQQQQQSRGERESHRDAETADEELRRRKRRELMQANAAAMTAASTRRDSGHAASFDDFLHQDAEQPGRYRVHSFEEMELRQRRPASKPLHDLPTEPAAPTTIWQTQEPLFELPKPANDINAEATPAPADKAIAEPLPTPALQQEMETEAQKALREWEAQTQASEAFSEIAYTPSTLSLIDYPDAIASTTMTPAAAASPDAVAAVSPIQPSMLAPSHQPLHPQSIREWALNAYPPGTPPPGLTAEAVTLQPVAVQSEVLGGETSEARTETDSVVDLADDLSSVEGAGDDGGGAMGEVGEASGEGRARGERRRRMGNGRYLDVMSEASDGAGFVTPSSWTDVGSQVSEEEEEEEGERSVPSLGR